LRLISIEYHKIKSFEDIYNPTTVYHKKIRDIIYSNDNLLILVPDSTNKNKRLKILKSFNNS
jgi:hypothetical protein